MYELINIPEKFNGPCDECHQQHHAAWESGERDVTKLPVVRRPDIRYTTTGERLCVSHAISHRQELLSMAGNQVVARFCE